MTSPEFQAAALRLWKVHRAWERACNAACGNEGVRARETEWREAVAVADALFNQRQHMIAAFRPADVQTLEDVLARIIIERVLATELLDGATEGDTESLDDLLQTIGRTLDVLADETRAA